MGSKNVFTCCISLSMTYQNILLEALNSVMLSAVYLCVVCQEYFFKKDCCYWCKELLKMVLNCL